MRALSRRPPTVALVVAALAVLIVAGRLLSTVPSAHPPATVGVPTTQVGAPTAAQVRLPDLIGQPLAQAITVLHQTGLKATVEAQVGLQGRKPVMLHPKTQAGSAIVIHQDPPAGERAPTGGVVHVWVSTDVQPNNTPRRVRLGPGAATAAYPIAAPGTATHQLTVLVTMPAAASVEVWLETGPSQRLPVLPGMRDATTTCQPARGQVLCGVVFDALDSEQSGLWTVQLAKRSAPPVAVQITVAFAPR
jgi:hypothetical protein